MDGAPSGLKKGTWNEEEDNRLRKCIEMYGEGQWHLIPERAGLNRCRKSCRLRWLNYLTPNIKRGNFGEDEVELIIRLHGLLGNKWSLIAGRLPGRTANDVKNYWNSHLQKQLRGREEGSIKGAIEGKAPKNIPYKPRATRFRSKRPEPTSAAQDIQIRNNQNVTASSSISVSTTSDHEKQCFSEFIADNEIAELGTIWTFSSLGEEMMAEQLPEARDINDYCMQEGRNASTDFDTQLWNLEISPK